MQEVLKDFLDEKIYSSKIYQVFGYVLQIMICSLVLFAMIFQTCYSIYMRYKFWCLLQSHLHQDLIKLKLASWSSSNTFVLDWEVHIFGQSNQTQCCQQLAPLQHFFKRSCVALHKCEDIAYVLLTSA